MLISSKFIEVHVYMNANYFFLVRVREKQESFA